jgi:geranylgeranyl pyrophosphate synthase
MELIRKTLYSINELINGQMFEISFKDTAGMTWSDWEDIAAQKTGALFRLIFEGVFLISGVDILDYTDQLYGIGRIIGKLYQMRDDLLDAMGLKEGRLQGSDILEGKMTCLSIKALEKGDEKARIIRDALLGGDKEGHDSRRKQLISLYEDLGIIAGLKKDFSGILERCRKHPITMDFPQIKPFFNDFLDLLVIENGKRGVL